MSIVSELRIESFAIRRLLLDVHGQQEAGPNEASIGISYDFFRHESEANKFRIALFVKIASGSAEVEYFTLEAEADSFVALPEDVDDHDRDMLLTNGVALLYSTLRGSLAGVLGQTTLRGFVLPSIDMNKVVQARAEAEAAASADDECPSGSDSNE